MTQTDVLSAAAIRNPDPVQGLAALHLSQAEYAQLATQGFVTSEWRGSRGPYFKLRFRQGAKQVVRYLGADPTAARALDEELHCLQAAHRRHQLLRALVQQAARALRQAKQTLEPLLQDSGYHFHGRAIRAFRGRPIDPPATAADPTYCPGEHFLRRSAGPRPRPATRAPPPRATRPI